MKRVKMFHGFGIYQRSLEELERADAEGVSVSSFLVYLPGEGPAFFSSPEWEADSLQECIDFLADR